MGFVNALASVVWLPAAMLTLRRLSLPVLGGILGAGKGALDGTPGALSVKRLQLRGVGRWLGHDLPKLGDVPVKTITGPARENGADLRPSTYHVHQ